MFSVLSNRVFPRLANIRTYSIVKGRNALRKRSNESHNLQKKTKNMKTKLKVAATSVFASALPFIASAQYTDACTLVESTFKAIRVFGTIVLVVAVVMILWAAFLFITGSGNEDSLKKAKTYLIFSLVGLAVALLATSAEGLVSSLFPNAQIVSGCPRNVGGGGIQR